MKLEPIDNAEAQKRMDMLTVGANPLLPGYEFAVYRCYHKDDPSEVVTVLGILARNEKGLYDSAPVAILPPASAWEELVPINPSTPLEDR